MGMSDERVAIVGFESALEFWRDDSNLGFYEDCLDLEGELLSVARVGLEHAVTNEDGCLALGISLSSERPLDLVSPYGVRGQSDRIRLHRAGSSMCENSFVLARNHVLVAIPELVFLEAAASYSMIELAKLGMELCGTYALDTRCEDGFAPRRRICGVGRIKRYLSRCRYVPGLQLARRVADRLMDASNSPLESKVMLALTLPPKYGGLGLRAPTLNERHEATSLQAETIGEHQYFFDAKWSGTKRSGRRYSVDCEVDSHAHFNDASKARADVARKDDVQFMRSTHISITSDDFRSAESFMKKGLMIAKLIGQRVRRYPRRGSSEEQAEYQRYWSERMAKLDSLLKELASDAHLPRPRPSDFDIARTSDGRF